jgi:hypothetical protein
MLWRSKFNYQSKPRLEWLNHVTIWKHGLRGAVANKLWKCCVYKTRLHIHISSIHEVQWKHNGTPYDVPKYKIFCHLIFNFKRIISVLSFLHFRFPSVVYTNMAVPCLLYSVFYCRPNTEYREQPRKWRTPTPLLPMCMAIKSYVNTQKSILVSLGTNEFKHQTEEI